MPPRERVRPARDCVNPSEKSTFLSQLVRRLFVDRAPRANGDNSDGPVGSINAVDDAEPTNAVLPVTLQFLLKGFAIVRIGADGSYGVLDAALQFWREMADDFGDGRRDIRPETSHYRLRFFTGWSGSPNTSSKDKPFSPFAKYRSLSRICRISSGSLNTSSVSFNRSYSA